MTKAFSWKELPAQVFVESAPGQLLTAYYRNVNSPTIHAISILPNMERDHLLIVSYLIRRHYADRMKEYILQQCHRAESQPSRAGTSDADRCLPVAILDLPVPADTHMLDARRLINWFVYVMNPVVSAEYLQADPATFYIRDPDVRIPSFEAEDVVKHVLQTYSTVLDGTFDHEAGGVSIAVLFRLISAKIIKVLKSSQGQVKKCKGLVSDTPLADEFHKCIQSVEERLREYRLTVSCAVLDPANRDMWAVKQFVKQVQKRPTQPAYVNDAITFKTMFHGIGEVLNCLCLNVMPKLSMTDAVGASVFQMLYLREMDLLGSFAHQINLPILCRLVTACFKDVNVNSHEAVDLLRTRYPAVYHLLTSLPPLCKQGDLESWMTTHRDAVTHTFDALVSQLLLDQHSELMNGNVLYYAVDTLRGCTLEYYLILTICQYTKAIVISEKGGNKHSRDLNRKTSIASLFGIVAAMYHYIHSLPRDLIHVHVLTDRGFGDDPMYRRIMSRALEDFLKVNIDTLM